MFNCTILPWAPHCWDYGLSSPRPVFAFMYVLGEIRNLSLFEALAVDLLEAGNFLCSGRNPPQTIVLKNVALSIQ